MKLTRQRFIAQASVLTLTATSCTTTQYTSDPAVTPPGAGPEGEVPLEASRILYQVVMAKLDRAVRDRDGPAPIRDAFAGRVLAILGHDDRVLCAHYDSDGMRVGTASADASAQIWR